MIIRGWHNDETNNGAKAPHIWSWGLAHMELMVDIYSIKGLTPYNT